MSYENDLYQQVILDHNKNPRNFKEMENGTHSCDGKNPLCGDDLTLYLNVSDDGKIDDISFMGSGCAISKASASLMTTFLKGKSVEEAKTIFKEFHKMVTGELDPEEEEHHLGKLTIFTGVREFSSRIKCASLVWHTLICAIDKEEEMTIED